MGQRYGSVEPVGPGDEVDVMVEVKAPRRFGVSHGGRIMVLAL